MRDHRPALAAWRALVIYCGEHSSINLCHSTRLVVVGLLIAHTARHADELYVGAEEH